MAAHHAEGERRLLAQQIRRRRLRSQLNVEIRALRLLLLDARRATRGPAPEEALVYLSQLQARCRAALLSRPVV